MVAMLTVKTAFIPSLSYFQISEGSEKDIKLCGRDVKFDLDCSGEIYLVLVGPHRIF